MVDGRTIKGLNYVADFVFLFIDCCLSCKLVNEGFGEKFGSEFWLVYKSVVSYDWLSWWFFGN